VNVHLAAVILTYNNAEDVVGVVDNFGSGSLRRMGFVRRAGAIMLIDFPGSEPFNGTSANGINDAGLVVGRFSEATSGLRTHGFILRGEHREPFDAPGASHFTEAADINNEGVIVGRTFLDSDGGIGSAFVRTGDNYQFFRPDFVRGPFGIAFYGLNDLGNTVGRVLEETGFLAFAILDGAYMSFTIPGSSTTVAQGINNADQIVGWYCAPDCSSVHGFLMDFSGIYRIDAPAEGSYGTALSGINDDGAIVGSVLFHQFPVRKVLVGSPCDAAGDPCVDASRIGDPVIEFMLNVGLDIKPGSKRNPINLRSKGNIPVAILTSDTFDATQVNWETVRFGPTGATERHQRVHVRDADYDGDMDVILHFKIRDTGILCSDTDATLTGETFSGEEITGSDVIKIVKCPKNKKNKKKK